MKWHTGAASGASFPARTLERSVHDCLDANQGPQGCNIEHRLSEDIKGDLMATHGDFTLKAFPGMGDLCAFEGFCAYRDGSKVLGS